MANPEHIEVVKAGKEAIEKWLREHPLERLDLRGAELSGADLPDADLTWAELSGANLSAADLSRADLHRADLYMADLHRADLFMADLSRANLSRANFSGANLSAADLSEATLRETDLSWANLLGVSLSEADLPGANLFGANLAGADLTGADLAEANLAEANLFMAILYKARCIRTTFSGVDLSQATGLRGVEHFGPSSIGIDTLIQSFRRAEDNRMPALEAFFRGAGVPEELLEGLPRILADIKYGTCFIAHAEPDRAFAEKLHQDLQSRGVSCWLYSMDATSGERAWPEISGRRQDAEKMVVLCSAQALVRDGVLKEIEEQIDEDPDKMLPVSLDNLWTEAGFLVQRGSRDLKPFLLERNYADFSDASFYEKSLERVAAALRRVTERLEEGA